MALTRYPNDPRRYAIGLLFALGVCVTVAIFLALRDDPTQDAKTDRENQSGGRTAAGTDGSIRGGSLGRGRPASAVDSEIIDPADLGLLLSLDGFLRPGPIEKMGLEPSVASEVDTLIADTFDRVAAFQVEMFEVVENEDGTRTIIVPSSEANQRIRDQFRERLAGVLPGSELSLVRDEITTGVDLRTGSFGLRPMLLEVESSGRSYEFHVRVLPTVRATRDSTVEQVRESQAFSLKSMNHATGSFYPDGGVPVWLAHFYESSEEPGE